ncbi:MAG: 2-aminoethylphosphonate--pyruvate transaminase [Candidatus Omnitrophica bacterium]|nr:2-aminoethylphosphonate--pyruvate transaminase [Candidatus Omnitrophota bacterium]
MSRRPTSYKDKPLYTPGPLTTSRTVKQAMLRDLGSRDTEFISMVRSIREKLLSVAGVERGAFEAVILQGSGTFSVEAVFSSTVPPDGKVLILSNGAYGERMAKICQVLKINREVIRWPEDRSPSVDETKKALGSDPSITHVAIVHCETTTGILNDLESIGKAVKEAGKIYFVDAMSSFGAIPIDFETAGIDYLVSSANKCIEGVPGFGFVIARTSEFAKTQGYARSLSLDLHSQWKGLESNGQFRFTPPTHALIAFHQALLELEEEGGVEGRMSRYQENHRVLIEGMRKMGFQEYLAPTLQGWIITSFLYPEHPNFNFEVFYNHLNDMGFVIYPGKLSQAECFRIGNIGRLESFDMSALLLAIDQTLDRMKISREC